MSLEGESSSVTQREEELYGRYTDDEWMDWEESQPAEGDPIGGHTKQEWAGWIQRMWIHRVQRRMERKRKYPEFDVEHVAGLIDAAVFSLKKAKTIARAPELGVGGAPPAQSEERGRTSGGACGKDSIRRKGYH